MNVTISNTGAHPIRVIIDHDTVNDSQIEAGDEAELEATGGIIELRELETVEDDSATAGEVDEEHH
jgi:hypothetical protein